jgi:hypothetical protein
MLAVELSKTGPPNNEMIFINDNHPPAENMMFTNDKCPPSGNMLFVNNRDCSPSNSNDSNDSNDSMDLLEIIEKNMIKILALNLFNASIVHYKDDLFLISFRIFENKYLRELRDKNFTKSDFNSDDFKPYNMFHPWTSKWADVTGGGGSPGTTISRFVLARIIKSDLTVIKVYSNGLDVEDIRLYKDTNGQIYLYGLKYIVEVPNTDKVGRQVRFNINNIESEKNVLGFSDYIVVCKQESKVEKNWMFDNNNLIYNIKFGSFFPVNVYNYNNNLKKCDIVDKINNTSFFDDYNKLYKEGITNEKILNSSLIRFSGGSPLLLLPNGNKLFIGHIVVDYKNLNYNINNSAINENLQLFKSHPEIHDTKAEKSGLYARHHYEFIYYLIFIELNSNNDIIKLSKPFSMFTRDNTGVNFPCGLTINNNELYFTFGESDYLTLISHISVSDLEKRLIDINVFIKNPELFKFQEVMVKNNNHKVDVDIFNKYLKYKTKYLQLKQNMY